MGAKAPTPAPNRRPDGSIDPTYRLPPASPAPPPFERQVHPEAVRMLLKEIRDELTWIHEILDSRLSTPR
jgi:hypothetical protein